MKTSYAVDSLAALAQETRLNLFRLLVRHAPEGLAAGQIARRLHLPSPTLSFHLNVLAAAGLVLPHKNGRSIRYSANLDTVTRLTEFLLENYSAGSHPKGSVHPAAIRQLEIAKLPTSGVRSKDWSEFAEPDAPKMDFVFTVCDNAAKEVCPVWPGQPITAHWGVPDPAAAEGTPEQIDRAFCDAFMILERRISLMLCLPLASLDTLTIKKEVDRIGKQ